MLIELLGCPLLFVMALIVGYLLITNYQHFVHSVSGLLGILSPFITGFVIAYLLSGSQKNRGITRKSSFTSR